MNSRGFTLIELIAVLLLVSILSAVAFSRFSNGDISKVQSSRDHLVAALLFAQQIAMARDSSANPIRLTTTANSVTVTESGVDLLYAGIQYPLVLPTGVTLTPALTLDYNKLGETSATSFALSAGGVSANVTLSASGYAD